MAATVPNLTRRPVQDSDRALLHELFADAHAPLFLLEPEVARDLVDLQVRAQEREYAVAYPRATHEILVVDGTPVGRLVLDDAPGCVRVVDLCVASAHRGRGIGSAVLRDVVRAAQSDGRTVRLSVWSGNTGARRLYESCGFVADRDHDAVGHVEMTRSS